MDCNIPELAKKYKDALLEDVVPFWQKYSPDLKCGGFFTCLDRDGSVFDTDKFVWLQARETWFFSILYNRVEKKAEWLELARHGRDFLMAHGRAENGDWYFLLTRDGQPLVQPYNIFSDCFAAMALSQYALAAGDEESRSVALATYQRILERRDNPKGKYEKSVGEARQLSGFALPMILANLTLELQWMLDGEQNDSALAHCIDMVFGKFLDTRRNIIHEAVSADGEFADCFEGRLINPGHGIEAMWFFMDIAERRGDKKLIEQCAEIILSTLEFGWDKEYGGIFYFLDVKGSPPQQLEWDQKLWWVHLESLIALSMAWRLTQDDRIISWYHRIHNYAWSHFPDPENGEWFGYLNRRGEVLLPLKGGKWKGCFHVPRALYMCYRQFEKMA